MGDTWHVQYISTHDAASHDFCRNQTEEPSKPEKEEPALVSHEGWRVHRVSQGKRAVRRPSFVRFYYPPPLIHPSFLALWSALTLQHCLPTLPSLSARHHHQERASLNTAASCPCLIITHQQRAPVKADASVILAAAAAAADPTISAVILPTTPSNHHRPNHHRSKFQCSSSSLTSK
jgi:hypothetical protein